MAEPTDCGVRGDRSGGPICGLRPELPRRRNAGHGHDFRVAFDPDAGNPAAGGRRLHRPVAHNGVTAQVGDASTPPFPKSRRPSMKQLHQSLAVLAAFALIATVALQAAPAALAASGSSQVSEAAPAECSSGAHSLSTLRGPRLPGNGQRRLHERPHGRLHRLRRRRRTCSCREPRGPHPVRSTQCLTDFSLDFERTSGRPRAAVART